jgi:hypothetical protein
VLLLTDDDRLGSLGEQVAGTVARMGLRDLLKKIFGSGNATPPDATRLSGTSENSLGSSLQSLPAGERGWITLAEAACLFSTEESQYAFGDYDEVGKSRLAQFASQYRCAPIFMPTEGRLYFARNA